MLVYTAKKELLFTRLSPLSREKTKDLAVSQYHEIGQRLNTSRFIDDSNITVNSCYSKSSMYF